MKDEVVGVDLLRRDGILDLCLFVDDNVDDNVDVAMNGIEVYVVESELKNTDGVIVVYAGVDVVDVVGSVKLYFGVMYFCVVVVVVVV